MVYDLKKEKEKFIQSLKELDEIKEIKKMNVTNYVIYILLILTIPLVCFLGFYFKMNIICIVAAVVLVALLIYTCMNNSKCKKIVFKIITDEVTEFFHSKYGEIKVEEQEKEDICEKNNELFARNNAIEEMNSLAINTDIYTDHLIRFRKNEDYIDLLSYYEDTYGYQAKHLEYCDFVLVTKIKEDGVLCLKSNSKNIVSKKDKEIFEKCIKINEDGMKKTLEKIEKTKKYEKYIELTEIQKQNLLEIYNKYSSGFVIVIKDRYLFLKSKLLIGTYSDVLKNIFDVQNCLDEILTMLNV